jgi:hypothetical protein
MSVWSRGTIAVLVTGGEDVATAVAEAAVLEVEPAEFFRPPTPRTKRTR